MCRCLPNTVQDPRWHHVHCVEDDHGASAMRSCPPASRLPSFREQGQQSRPLRPPTKRYVNCMRKTGKLVYDNHIFVGNVPNEFLLSRRSRYRKIHPELCNRNSRYRILHRLVCQGDCHHGAWERAPERLQDIKHVEHHLLALCRLSGKVHIINTVQALSSFLSGLDTALRSV